MKGNGGWMRIDIIKDNKFVKMGDIEIDTEEMSQEEVEQNLYNFFFKKYREAKFLVQELIE